MKLTTSVPNASSLDLKLNLDHHKFIFSKKLKSSNMMFSPNGEKEISLFEFGLFIKSKLSYIFLTW